MQIGVPGRDYTEHFSISTQALVFSLSHWQSSLKTPESRKGAGDLFDALVSKSLGVKTHVMFFKSDLELGVVAGDGVPIEVRHGAITDIAAVASISDVMQTGLNRIVCSSTVDVSVILSFSNTQDTHNEII